ncbi:hypothetical protein B0H19DRAFT_1101980 [Mycena capillaripes]|nr:hypothetical protein B0H19DRAFT_1101980 [Mycena capillaripes]
MNRLVRLVGRRPTLFAPRRVFAARPLYLRHYSQKPISASRLESLYDEYIATVSARLPPEAPVPFEDFRRAVEDFERDGVPTSDGEEPAPLQDKYDNMLAALAELEATDPNFDQTLATLTDAIRERMDGPGGDPLFRQRLENLNLEASEREVAQRVAQLVLSSTEDKFALEQIEDRLASYNGPLATLNVALEWYLNNPEKIDVEDQRAADVPTATRVHDKNSYYYQDTPIDELVAHLRDRDVQYAIKNRLENEDREQLFELLDRLVVPVFNEDMDVLNAIASIFSKYEDVHLVFQTEPRLPRLRRLEVFKRLLPKPDDETPVTQAKEKAEIEELVAETKRKAEIVEAEKRAKIQPWPNLMTRDPLLDSRDVLELPPTKENPFHNRVVIRNHHSIFHEALQADSFDFNDPNYEPTRTDDIEEQNIDPIANLPLPANEVMGLITLPIKSYVAKQQTGKGKIARNVWVMVVGDGNGMVGLGFGKHENGGVAMNKAVRDGVRNMDWVERFEDRTIWTEVRTKFGATTVILRPRPVGFGLRCNPFIHPLLKAAGIKDISAKVWGSRNRIGVVKATLRLLQAGHAPLGMGDGLGGPGRKSHKGTGLRNKNQIERERGRKLVDLRV